MSDESMEGVARNDPRCAECTARPFDAKNPHTWKDYPSTEYDDYANAKHEAWDDGAIVGFAAGRAALPDPPTEPAVCDRCGAPKGLRAVGESCNQNCGGRVVARPAAAAVGHAEHVAWNAGWAARAAAHPLPDGVLAFVNWFAEGPCGCDGDPQDPCDSCRALALLTRLDDLAGRAAATPDQPDDWTAAILTLRRAMCTPAGREQVERELIRPFAASPDERLREAGDAMAAWIRDNTCGSECGDNCEAGANALARWDNTLAALAAADREAPDEPKETTT